MKESEFIKHEFDITLACATHLIAQGERSLGKPGDPQPKQEVDPRFVAENGNRDAIGFLLGEHYLPAMEGLNVRQVLADYQIDQVWTALGVRADFNAEQSEEHQRRLQWLVRVHDDVGPLGWIDSFTRELGILAYRMLIARGAEGIDGGEARWLPKEQFVTHVLPRP